MPRLTANVTVLSASCMCSVRRYFPRHTFHRWSHRRWPPAPAQMRISAAVAAASSTRTTLMRPGRRRPHPLRRCHRLCALRQLLARRKRVVGFLQYVSHVNNTEEHPSKPIEFCLYQRVNADYYARGAGEQSGSAKVKALRGVRLFTPLFQENVP